MCLESKKQIETKGQVKQFLLTDYKIINLEKP